MQSDTVLTVISTVAATALVTWYLTRRFISRHYETAKALDFERKRNALINEIKDTIVLGPDFAARLDNAYRRGKDEGQKAELQKLAIVYEPYQELTEEYFGIKKRAEIGYNMQLHYAGLPIGQPTRKTTHTNVEFDADKIEKIMNSELMSSLNSLCQLLGSKGMSGKILPRKVS
jgi:hypothetical protein